VALLDLSLQAENLETPLVETLLAELVNVTDGSLIEFGLLLVARVLQEKLGPWTKNNRCTPSTRRGVSGESEYVPVNLYHGPHFERDGGYIPVSCWSSFTAVIQRVAELDPSGKLLTTIAQQGVADPRFAQAIAFAVHDTCATEEMKQAVVNVGMSTSDGNLITFWRRMSCEPIKPIPVLRN
jgi:hypothetical protein